MSEEPESTGAEATAGGKISRLADASSGLGVLSFLPFLAVVFGVRPFLSPLLVGAGAIVSGLLARSRIRKSGGALRGGGYAVAGIVMGFWAILAAFCLR